MDKKLLRDKIFLGEGTSGRCYEIKTGEVVKLFKFSRDIKEIEKYRQFSKFQNDSILFPYDFLVKNNKFIGYVTKKASGQILDYSLRVHSLESISRNSIKLEKDIKYISYNGVMMFDVHRENMFYDGYKFSIIDTDGFDSSAYEEESTYLRNVNKVKRAIFEVIRDELVSKNNPVFQNELYLKMYKYVTWDYSISEMILLFRDILEKHYGESIDKLCDIKQLKK